MKKLIILLLLYLPVCAGAQQLMNDTARVSLQSGVYVFAYSRPIASHTVLGEVSFSGKGSTYTITINNIPNTFTSGVYYEQIRTALISQAVLANRETEAIIIKDRSAVMIKFDPDATEKDLAIADKIRGIAVFVDSEPKQVYNYICTKKVSLQDSTNDIVNKLAQKAYNAKKGIEGIIITFKDEGGSADCVSF